MKCKLMLIVVPRWLLWRRPAPPGHLPPVLGAGALAAAGGAAGHVRVPGDGEQAREGGRRAAPGHLHGAGKPAGGQSIVCIRLGRYDRDYVSLV